MLYNVVCGERCMVCDVFCCVMCGVQCVIMCHVLYVLCCVRCVLCGLRGEACDV